MKKKHLIISFNYPPVVGGIETYSYELIGYFSKVKDFQYIVNNNLLISKLNRNIGLIIFQILIIFKIILKNYETIQITNYNLFPILRIYSVFHKKTKFIINIWGLELVYNKKRGLLPKIYKIIFNPNSLIDLKNFYFVVSSNASKKLMNKIGFKDNQIIKISLGINRINIKNFIGKDMKYDKYFLYVGRIVNRKGLSWFANKVLPNFPNHKLKIVGPIVDEKEFASIPLNSQIEYLGTVTNQELKKLRSSALVSIVPNIILKNDDDFEAFCFVTIESIADGSLVLASDYQGIKDALSNGKIGYLAKPSDVNDWVNKISEIIDMTIDNRKDKLISDMKYINKELNWNDIFKLTHKLHKEL